VTGREIFESDEWIQFVLGEGWRRQEARRDLLSRLSEDDAVELVELAASGSSEEAAAADELLVALARAADPRLSGPALQTWLDHQKRHGADRPAKLLCSEALYVLMSRERGWVEDFLLDRLRKEPLTPRESRVRVIALSVLATARALAELLRLRNEGGGLGVECEQLLESKGLVPSKLVEERAAKWRAERKAEDLQWLHSVHIARLQEGTPLGEVVRLLGEPDGRAEGVIWYTLGEESGYFVRLDTAGRILAAEFP